MPFIEEMSNREKDWAYFSEVVNQHVGEYTVPQYGDKPHDQITNWTPEDCVRDIKKRCERFGSNQREGHDELDLVKIAHIAGVAWVKIDEKNKENSERKSLFEPIKKIIKEIKKIWD